MTLYWNHNLLHPNQAIRGGFRRVDEEIGVHQRILSHLHRVDMLKKQGNKSVFALFNLVFTQCLVPPSTPLSFNSEWMTVITVELQNILQMSCEKS